MRWVEASEHHLLVLDVGEQVHESILAFCQEARVQSCGLSGIGAVKDVEIGYFVVEERDYATRLMPGELELVGLTGNVTLKDGVPFAHLHATLGDHEFHSWAGHLIRATVAVTAEIIVTPLGIRVERKETEPFGLHLIDLPG